jgi:hypothetical protein
MSPRQVSFSALQYLLKLSYSIESEDQEKAAIELATLVESTVFPTVSFGPIAHALCHLVSSTNRTVACFSARALKLLLLDDSLRSQVGTTGISKAVVSAMKHWEEEVLCIRELLGVLQTLCWDRQCVSAVLSPDIISYLVGYMQASDDDVNVLALCTIANILYYSDTIILDADGLSFELCKAMPVLVKIVRATQHRSMRFYSMAAIANASAHASLAKALVEIDALEVCEEQEKQSLGKNIAFGSKLSICAHAAATALRKHIGDMESGTGNTGASAFAGLSILSGGSEKYNFKWGKEPAMRIELDPGLKTKNTNAFIFALIVWGSIIMWTFFPALKGAQS